MQRYARWLFGSAAALNILVGIGLLFFRGIVAGPLGLDPIAGTNLVLVNLTGTFILLFGYAYALTARDPVRYRPFIPFGAAASYWPFLADRCHGCWDTSHPPFPFF
jgi:hypothetical protein